MNFVHAWEAGGSGGDDGTLRGCKGCSRTEWLSSKSHLSPKQLLPQQ